MASLQKRPGRRFFYVVYYLRGKNGEKGRQVWRCTGTENEDLARKVLAEVEAAIEGKYRERKVRDLLAELAVPTMETPHIRIDSLWALYESQPKPRQMSAATARTKRINVNHFVKWVLRAHPELEFLHELSEEVASAYFSSQRGLVGQTRNNRLSALHDVFRVIRIAAGLQKNIWDAIPRVDKGVVQKSALTLDQVKLLFEKSLEFPSRERTFWPAAIAIGFHTGLRWGDVVTLEWKEIRLEEGILVLVERKKRRRNKSLALILHEDFLPWLLLAGEKWGRDGYVWPEIAAEYLRDGQHAVRWLLKEFNDLCALAGIQVSRKALEGENRVNDVKEVGYHSFRYTFVTELENRGEDLSTIQKIVGHGSPRMTGSYSYSLAAGLKVKDVLPSLQKRREE
jgi:integrase